MAHLAGKNNDGKIDRIGNIQDGTTTTDYEPEEIDRKISITSSLAFCDWNTVFPNATSIATLLDKLTHHADITVIEGDSYRVHESQKEAAARRKKR